jgi:hypothetical protein
MDDDLTPQETERVRRLLAEARHTEPMPAEVADRIDRALSDLADEPAPAPVVRLAERRRNAGRLLLAAAAVVVGGVAVGQVVGGGQENAALDSTTAGEAEEGQGRPAPDRDNLGSGQSEADPEGADELPGAVSETRRSISRLPAQPVSSATFASDAEQLRPVATDREAARDRAPSPESGSLAQNGFGCAAGAWGGGRYVRVAFDREAGWLVYRAPRGGTQVVDLFLCGEDSPERSTTLPFDGS